MSGTATTTNPPAMTMNMWHRGRDFLRNLWQDANDVPMSSYILFALAGSVIGWCLAAEAVIRAGGFPWGFWPEAWRYADTNAPMIHTADGFYYIHAAKRALADGFAGIGLFPGFTAFFAKALGTSVESTAFQMSLLTNLGLGIVAAVFARLAKAGRLGVFLTCTLVPLVPAWLERGGPGQYDTDLAINLLLQTGLLFMAKAAVGLKFNTRASLWLLGAVAAFGALGLAWGRNNALGLAVPAFGLWCMFFLPLRFAGVRARLTAVAMLALWGALIFLFPDMTLAPQAITAFIHGKVTSFLGLPALLKVNDYRAFGFHTDMLSRSVQELASIPLPLLLERLGGSVAGGVTMVAVALWAAFKSPILRFPILYGLIWVALGTRSIRLIYLGTFPLCLAMGLWPRLAATCASQIPNRCPVSLPSLDWAWAWLGQSKRWLGLAFGMAVAVAVTCGGFQWRLHHGVEVRWDRHSDALLEPLRREMGDQPAWMWNWWDDGYFLAARLGAKATAHFNGSSTNPLKGYIPGHSFVMENRDVAAKWMRFFAIRGQAEAIQPAIDVWGPDEAWEKVERVLAGEEIPGVEKIENWRDWFFPKGKVYWYIPSYIFGISNWWVPLGLSRDPDANEIRPHIERIRRQDFVYNPQTQALTVDMSLFNRGYKEFGMVIHTSATPLNAPWPDAKAPYIVYSGQNDYAYITDQIGVRTLPLYMMGPGGPSLRQFRQVAFEPTFGGVWEVLE